MSCAPAFSCSCALGGSGTGSHSLGTVPNAWQVVTVIYGTTVSRRRTAGQAGPLLDTQMQGQRGLAPRLVAVLGQLATPVLYGLNVATSYVRPLTLASPAVTPQS